MYFRLLMLKSCMVCIKKSLKLGNFEIYFQMKTSGSEGGICLFSLDDIARSSPSQDI